MMGNLLDEQPFGMTKDPEETIVSTLYFFYYTMTNLFTLKFPFDGPL